MPKQQPNGTPGKKPPAPERLNSMQQLLRRRCHRQGLGIGRASVLVVESDVIIAGVAGGLWACSPVKKPAERSAAGPPLTWGGLCANATQTNPPGKIKGAAGPICFSIRPPHPPPHLAGGPVRCPATTLRAARLRLGISGEARGAGEFRLPGEFRLQRVIRPCRPVRGTPLLARQPCARQFFGSCPPRVDSRFCRAHPYTDKGRRRDSHSRLEGRTELGRPFERRSPRSASNTS